MAGIYSTKFCSARKENFYLPPYDQDDTELFILWRLGYVIKIFLHILSTAKKCSDSNDTQPS